jgi:hypothetical protein
VEDRDAREDPRRPAGHSKVLSEALVRAQKLVDSKPPREYPLWWCAEAEHVGDISVLALLRPGSRQRRQ